MCAYNFTCYYVKKIIESNQYIEKFKVKKMLEQKKNGKIILKCKISKKNDQLQIYKKSKKTKKKWLKLK